jgi:hypothetical protein
MKEDDPEPKAPLLKREEILTPEQREKERGLMNQQEQILRLKKYKAQQYRKALNILTAGFLAHLRRKGLLPKRTLH